ncbi:MAG: L-threonylcarbamoyladenylate synthase [Sulfolobales archaeon]
MAIRITRILKVDSYKIDEILIREAADVIRRGGIVAFPTETVYGLGADAFNRDAVKRIFEVKRRPMDNPLIIHIRDLFDLEKVAREIPEKAFKLIERLWPGPLTLILPRNARVPLETTGGLDTVAVRNPAHPIALKLIELSKTPIAAPSANISGRPSPTRAEHVIEDLYGLVEVIIDGGETIYGLESTIINILTDPPTLLRPGAYPIELIEEILGEKILIPSFARGLGEADKALAPGMKYRHYAPKTPLVLVEAKSYDEEKLDRVAEEIVRLVKKYSERYKSIGVIVTRETLERVAHQLDKYSVKILEIGSRSNLFEIAKKLFDYLRKLDREKLDIALIEGVRDVGVGLAIMNRVRKASSERYIID